MSVQVLVDESTETARPFERQPSSTLESGSAIVEA
jgi:hypothetical protein